MVVTHWIPHTRDLNLGPQDTYGLYRTSLATDQASRPRGKLPFQKISPNSWRIDLAGLPALQAVDHDDAELLFDRTENWLIAAIETSRRGRRAR